ncbi:fimbrial protein [Citrobacter sp. Res13-Sevr-PEB04-36]|uniref:fimbrial protein n=1 Tax=Citrobacter sp. Res13-Sevr-PEB04-36 TaxID=2777960 RepID=UPI0018ACE165|nr:fimbrial protein [Citrobacter sp. Res13-Sevr-PEB04-36]
MINLPYASATNTITFNGSITDATCDVSLEYKGIKVGDAGTGSITLDEVSKTALSGVGSSAGQVPFFIVASNCTLGTPAKSKIAANFKSIHDDNQGNLNNIAGTNPATNVQLRLLDSARKPIKVNDPLQSSTTTFTNINSTPTDDTKMQYFVEYFSSLGSATSGAVSSDVQYELMYQ